MISVYENIYKGYNFTFKINFKFLSFVRIYIHCRNKTKA